MEKDTPSKRVLFLSLWAATCPVSALVELLPPRPGRRLTHAIPATSC